MSSHADGPTAVQAASPHHWIGLAVAYLLIPLALLVCGGDLGWWQAWSYSPLIVTVGVGGRIWAERRHPGLLAERQNMKKAKNAKGWDKILAPLMALIIAVIRTMLEDQTLKHELPGYRDYAQRVRYRLIPGIY